MPPIPRGRGRVVLGRRVPVRFVLPCCCAIRPRRRGRARGLALCCSVGRPHLYLPAGSVVLPHTVAMPSSCGRLSGRVVNRSRCRSPAAVARASIAAATCSRSQVLLSSCPACRVCRGSSPCAALASIPDIGCSGCHLPHKGCHIRCMSSMSRPAGLTLVAGSSPCPTVLLGLVSLPRVTAAVGPGDATSRFRGLGQVPGRVAPYC